MGVCHTCASQSTVCADLIRGAKEKNLKVKGPVRMPTKVCSRELLLFIYFVIAIDLYVICCEAALYPSRPVSGSELDLLELLKHLHGLNNVCGVFFCSRLNSDPFDFCRLCASPPEKHPVVKDPRPGIAFR